MSISLVEHYHVVDAKQGEIEIFQKRCFELAQQNHEYYKQITEAKEILAEVNMVNGDMLGGWLARLRDCLNFKAKESKEN